MTVPSTLAPVRPLFRAVTLAVAPPSSSFDEGGWLRAEALVDETLADRPAGVRRQIVLFFRILDGLARVRFGRGLARLPVEKAVRLLRRLEGSPVLLLRRGVWGVRTLAFMGVYGQRDVRDALGYGAALRGWQDRPEGRQGPWPGRKGAGGPEAGILTAHDDEGTSRA